MIDIPSFNGELPEPEVKKGQTPEDLPRSFPHTNMIVILSKRICGQDIRFSHLLQLSCKIK